MAAGYTSKVRYFEAWDSYAGECQDYGLQGCDTVTMIEGTDVSEEHIFLHFSPETGKPVWPRTSLSIYSLSLSHTQTVKMEVAGWT
jgi:hypothetical protein